MFDGWELSNSVKKRIRRGQTPKTHQNPVVFYYEL